MPLHTLVISNTPFKTKIKIFHFFFWVSNKTRPYFNSHERDDVVKKRHEFVD